ncbi:MAG: hypothetical protein FWE38_02145 [Firmicutes bacterium]|nr:hypothetical protein [Bacillota bacterium]
MATCYGPFNFTSNITETEILDIKISKDTCRYTIAGRNICYTITAINNGDVTLYELLFSDALPENTQYVIGSFTVDGTPHIPMMANNTIQYPITLEPNIPVIIKFCVAVII